MTIGETYTLYAKHGSLNYGSATFTFDGYSDISQSLQLVKKSWFEVSEIEFARDNHQGAVTAFQNGVEETTDFRQMSTDLTVLLLKLLCGCVGKARRSGCQLSRRYREARRTTQSIGPREKILARGENESAERGHPPPNWQVQRLWQLNRSRYILNIALIVLLVVLLVSGGWTFYRYRRTKAIIQGD